MQPTAWLLAFVTSAGLMTAAGAAFGASHLSTPTIDVYKTPTCGCCSKWVDHLKTNGFAVHTIDVKSLDNVKARHRVPTDLGSCHTAIVAGYVIEGHVPAADIRRLLTGRPNIAGLAVPSMPLGSPGMEVSGKKPHPYRVLAFDRTGQTTVYASYGRER